MLVSSFLVSVCLIELCHYIGACVTMDFLHKFVKQRLVFVIKILERLTICCCYFLAFLYFSPNNNIYNRITIAKIILTLFDDTIQCSYRDWFKD